MGAHSIRRLQTNGTFIGGKWLELKDSMWQETNKMKTQVYVFLIYENSKSNGLKNQRRNAKEGKRREGGRERKTELRMTVVRYNASLFGNVTLKHMKLYLYILVVYFFKLSGHKNHSNISRKSNIKKIGPLLKLDS